MNILIVDDSIDDRRLLDRVLRSSGYPAPLQAASATEAFQLLGLDDPADPKVQVDVILMDIVMPETNGIGACQRIKASPRLADIPVLMVTGKTEVATLEAAFAAGARDYITKPIRRLELLARLQAALTLKWQSDARHACEDLLLKRNQQLEATLREIDRLRGIFLICSHCKKIQTDYGHWEAIDTYLQEHSEAEFHALLCATCARSTTRREATDDGHSGAATSEGVS